MWVSTVGLVNGKHRYLTAETFGFKINSNGQVLKKRQQWTIEPFPENLGPDGSISSAASVSSQCPGHIQQLQPATPPTIQLQQQAAQQIDTNDACILTFSSNAMGSSLTSIKSTSNGSSSSDQDSCGEEHENIAIKSHLNKYLAVDSFGNVTCDSDEKTENARFTITICSMSRSRSKDEHIFWAFKNVERGYYLGTTEDGMVCCNAKVPKSRAELWHLHLIPARGASFFALKSLGRKRFARVANQENRLPMTDRALTNCDNVQVQLDATISWGPETLFQFKYYDGGRYVLLTSDCLYLTNEGKCVNWTPPDESALPPQECLFTLEYHSGFLAFRDSFSNYLAAAGRSSVLKSRSVGVSRDELFVFECAPIQVSFRATFNNRWISIKQGVDLSANQTETVSKFETFQLTYHKQTQCWSIMTHDCNFWTLSHNTNTITICRPGDYEALTRGQFKLIWSETDATCSLKYIDADRNERWISARKSGQLFLANGPQSPAKFIMRFQNRRLLNLRPLDGSGFVGIKSLSSNQLEANKTAPDSIVIEYSELLDNNGPSNGCLLSSSFVSKSRRPPEVGPKPVDTRRSEDEQTINIFNVRLNSTKMGQMVLERYIGNGRDDDQEQKRNVTTVSPDVEHLKEIEDIVDDNNNETFIPDKTVVPESKLTNGSVESNSAPSVASIINSFSNVKLKPNNVAAGRQIDPVVTNRASPSVIKLATSFNNSVGQQQQKLATDGSSSDTASVITSCSSAASSELSNGSHGGGATDHLPMISSNKGDQLAQTECCYLKIRSNDRYLMAGDDNQSLICDATNKACAQSWILELRSHNLIAIRASDNHAYMQLGTNGTVYLSRCDSDKASLWEF